MSLFETQIGIPPALSVSQPRLAAYAGITGPLLFAVLTPIVALRFENFYWVSDGLSELMVGPGGWLQAALFIVLGGSLAMLVDGLSRKLYGQDVSTGTRFLYLAALCIIMLSVVPTEADHAVWSINRFVHDGFSAGAAVAFPVGCLYLSRGFKAEPGWRGLAVYSLATAAVAIAANALSLLALTSLEVTGVQQLITLGAGLIWMAAISIKLHCLSR